MKRVKSYSEWSEILLKVDQWYSNWVTFSKFHFILCIVFTPFRVNFYPFYRGFPFLLDIFCIVLSISYSQQVYEYDIASLFKSLSATKRIIH